MFMERIMYIYLTVSPTDFPLIMAQPSERAPSYDLPTVARAKISNHADHPFEPPCFRLYQLKLPPGLPTITWLPISAATECEAWDRLTAEPEPKQWIE
jgi:hypothetical protein